MGLFAALARRYRGQDYRSAAVRHTSVTRNDLLADYRGGRSARYMRLSEIDRLRAVPSGMPRPPQPGLVLQHVRELTEGLAGSIDEGSGGALDLLIESWVAGWIATVEAEYADRCGMIQRLRGQAEQWLRETTVELELARAKLVRLTDDYEALSVRLLRARATTAEDMPELGNDAQPGPERQAKPEPELAVEVELDFGSDTNGDGR